MTFDYPFHIRLQRLMYDKDMSQSELARRVGVGRSCMHNWYWGIRQPNLDALKRIRRALCCEWDELMGR